MADDTRDALSLTDDEEQDEFEDEQQLPELAGTLNKWTNYIHGWQDRYIVLKDGTLSYYKSETETTFGCRGAVSLGKAILTPHEFDECRLDVSVNDCLWYLRARNTEERQQWIDTLELHRQAESGYGSENSLRRHGSMLSLTSTASLSTSSATSFKRGRGLHEKLAEMETFRDILCRQVDTLQSYFDACASALAHQTVHDQELENSQGQSDSSQQRNQQRPSKAPKSFFQRIIRSKVENDDIDDVDDLETGNANNQSTTPGATKSGSGDKGATTFTDTEGTREKDIINILQQHGAHAIDFKGESFTFKATTAGILATLSHCIDLMSQREDAWKKRLEREVEKRKKIEEAYKTVITDRPKPIIHGGPDYEEGPHSIINEDEFFDAVDATLDKLEKDEEKKLLLVPRASPSGDSPRPDGMDLEDGRQLIKRDDSSLRPPLTSLDPSHTLYEQVNNVVNAHISQADMTASDVASTWQLIAEEGDMKVYKCEMEEDGIIVDPLKAVHTVKGVTGHELCYYFWNPEHRMEWEATIESSNVIEWVSKDTTITHQTLKRVWPATQRDSLFWSTIRHCPSEDDEGPDYWIVVNHSTEHPDCQLGKCVRIKFNVAMICQTVVQPPENGQDITRENLTCRIQYSANVNPGGWAPASVIRVISKRELPKFIKTFTSYVQEKTGDQSILF